MKMGRRGLVCAAILGLALATLVAAGLVARAQERSAERERRDEAARAAADLTSRFELSLVGLKTIKALFASTQEVTGRQFASFAEGLLRNSPFSTTLLVTRVPAPLRSGFERSPGSSAIRELSDGKLRRAAPRPEYYPVSYRFSRYKGFGGRLPIGLDLSVDPVRGPALAAARDTGSPQATRPVTLPESGRRGLLLFLPLYQEGAPLRSVEERRAALAHLAVSAFETEELGNAVKASRRPGTEIQIFDGGERVYGPAGELADADVEQLQAAGRDWTLVVDTPVHATLTLPATILAGGLVMSGLVALLLIGLGRRERYAQDLSDRRLAERERAEGAQRAAEERFQRAFEDSGVAMALVGVAGGATDRLLEVNDALCKLTGYPRQDLLGTKLSKLAHPDDSATRASTRRALAGEPGTAQFEQHLVDMQGESVWVLVTTSIVRDRGGQPQHRIVQMQDVSERKRFERRLQHLADHDSLTGLFNRRRFEDELGRELAAAARYRRGGAVLALDLDHFKYVNDSLGHSLGDELIARVSGLLLDRLREADIVARLGGDEFAVILPEADEQRAVTVAEDLLRTIRAGAKVAGPYAAVGATASIGIALFSDEPSQVTGEELLAEADIAMYDAKESGRDRCCVYSTSGRDARMAERLSWVERIRRALAEGRFVLHGQRIESLVDDHRQREELLLRMVGDDGDLIPPASFLRVAERYGLIQAIDRWVVREAIELLARLEYSGVDAVLEVNLSAKSVEDPELPELIESEIRRQGVNPSGLVFEMTETATIVNLERAKHFALFLRDLGCEFALDDFGAGFASFHYLKHFAFDYLKIDGEFTEDLPRNSTNQLLVRALVQIARGLGKRTIAEFVQDEETLVLLQELGVDYAQGFHVARPRPLDIPVPPLGVGRDPTRG